MIKQQDGKWCVYNKDGTKCLGCHPTEDEAKAQLVAVESAKHSLEGVEIFASGKWKGDEYTDADLDAIVAAHNELDYAPPLKAGHRDEPGAPAIGWLANLRRQGSKLLADIVDMSSQAYEAIKNRAYDTVSSEIYWDLERKGKKYPRALKAVALLGADIPAVADLRPLHALFETEAPVHAYSFTRADFAGEVQVNTPGEGQARRLIEEGKVDTSSAWDMTSEDENALLGNPEDWNAYGKWHLGRDSGAGIHVKAGWKYPFGKGGKVYRSALIAIRQRAGQQGAKSVFNAAGALVNLIDKGKHSVTEEGLKMAEGNTKVEGGDDIAKKYAALESENVVLRQKAEKVAQYEEQVRAMHEERRKERVALLAAECKIPAFREAVRVFADLGTRGESGEVKVYSEGKETTAEAIVRKLVRDVNEIAATLYSEQSKGGRRVVQFSGTADEASAEVDKRAKVYATEHKVEYGHAVRAVLQDDPGLKAAYIGL